MPPVIDQKVMLVGLLKGWAILPVQQPEQGCLVKTEPILYSVKPKS